MLSMIYRHCLWMRRDNTGQRETQNTYADIGCKYLISHQPNNVHDYCPPTGRPLSSCYLTDDPGKGNDGVARAVMDYGTVISTGDARLATRGKCRGPTVQLACKCSDHTCTGRRQGLMYRSGSFRRTKGPLRAQAVPRIQLECSVRREQIPPLPQPE